MLHKILNTPRAIIAATGEKGSTSNIEARGWMGRELNAKIHMLNAYETSQQTRQKPENLLGSCEMKEKKKRKRGRIEGD